MDGHVARAVVVRGVEGELLLQVERVTDVEHHLGLGACLVVLKFLVSVLDQLRDGYVYVLGVRDGDGDDVDDVADFH